MSGLVYKAPKRRTSPAGIEHCQFYLEHSSNQVEAGFSRLAHCYITVVAAGDISQKVTLTLTQGTQVRVSGFITSHKTQAGIGKLVLHANQIEII